MSGFQIAAPDRRFAQIKILLAIRRLAEILYLRKHQVAMSAAGLFELHIHYTIETSGAFSCEERFNISTLAR